MINKGDNEMNLDRFTDEEKERYEYYSKQVMSLVNENDYILEEEEEYNEFT